MTNEQLKRLFFGYIKKDGLFGYLKNCKKDIGNVFTKEILNLF
jgi:hypothetical protein